MQSWEFPSPVNNNKSLYQDRVFTEFVFIEMSNVETNKMFFKRLLKVQLFLMSVRMSRDSELSEEYWNKSLVLSIQ